MPDAADQNSQDLEKAPLDAVYQSLDTSARGLTTTEARARIEKYGRNELADKEASDLEKFLRFFWGPIAWMIEAAALLSLLMGHWADLAIILVLLFYNAISGFWQERKASDALAALKAGLAPKATALRDGEFAAIDAAEVVPGDVVRIKLGEVVPADVRFIDGEYISIDQAALTGESLPVSKKVGDEGYSGSIAKKGEMSAVVIGTGSNTFFGRTASLVAGAGGRASHSQRATTQIGDFLIVASVALAIILVGFELYRDIVVQTSWQWADLADIARMVLVLLIASIPVAMPTVMTVTNSLGAQALAKKKAIVSRLEAIEELAGVDVLCSDKTGTLTKNILTLGDPILFEAAERRRADRGRSPRLREGQRGRHRQGRERRPERPERAGRATRSPSSCPSIPWASAPRATVTDPQGRALRFTKGAPQVIIDLCGLDAETTEQGAEDRHGPGRARPARARRRPLERRGLELELPWHPLHARPAAGRLQGDHPARQGPRPRASRWSPATTSPSATRSPDSSGWGPT